MATTTTGKAIRQLLFSLIGGIGEIGQQVGAGATTTTVVDAGNLKGRSLAPSMFDNGTLRVTSGALQGQTTYIDYLDPGTGTLYLDGPLTGALGDGDEYEIWLKGIDPDYVDRLRDDVLTMNVSTWRQCTATTIIDGDLEEPGTLHWTAAGATTQSKTNGAAPDSKSRWLLNVVHTTAATDYLKSDTMNAQPGELYFLEVPVKAYVTASGAIATATAQPYDLDNSANIPLGGIKTSHVGKGWGRISLLFSIPTNCYNWELRLTSDTASSTTVWGQFSCNHRQATELTLPDRVRTKFRVGKMFWTTQVQNTTVYNNNNRYKLRPYWGVEREQIGSNVVLFFQPGLSNNAVFFYERGYYARLQTNYVLPAARLVGDAAPTDAPVEYAAAALAERVTKWLLDKYGAVWQDDWVRASAMLNYWAGEFGPEPQHVFENTQNVYIPDLRV